MEHCACHVLDPDNNAGHLACTHNEGRPPVPEMVFGVTANLGLWIEPARLQSWILEEIGQLRWENPQVTEYLRKHLEYRPRTLLAVLSYAYAIALYGSGDIAEACHSNPEFQSLCNARPPFEDELRAFRRHNRCLIEKILAGTFRRALGFSRAWETDMPLQKWQETLGVCAVNRLDMARHLDHADE